MIISETQPKLILASRSSIRAKLMNNAGIKFSIKPSDIDEIKVKTKQKGRSAQDIALILADAKAHKISAIETNSIIIGVDSVLVCDGKMYDKPETIEDVKKRLVLLRGKTHQLISSICVKKNMSTIWKYEDRADLTMYQLSDVFIDEYVNKYGPMVMGSVGAYRLEAEGIQLFEQIKGDYFTILGIPLQPLIRFLREQKFILS